MKNIFNRKLFVQAFLQLKIAGIVCLVCSSVFTVLVPIMYNIDRSDNTDSVFNRPMELMDIPSYFFPLLIVLFIITPLMCFLIFNFLTKRNGSDFYHSAPVKRKCIYISFLSAVVLWAAIIIAWYTFVLCTMFAITTDILVMNIANIIIFDINILVSCILVAAVSGLACSITGTLFSNFAVAVTILFAPRILISAFCANIYDTNPLVNANCIPGIFNVSCNMPAHALFLPGSLFYGHSNDSVFMGLNFATLYTLILAAIYVVIGVYAFVKRPSESAGKAFSYKIFNSIFRIFVGYIVSFIAVSIVYEQYTDSIYYNSEASYNITSIITVIAFAVVLMYICEVISSRSLKKGIMAFVTSPVVLVLDVITFFGLVFVGNTIANDRIDPKNTEYISLQNIDSYYFDLYENGLQYDFYDSNNLDSCFSYEISLNYYENGINNVKITNPEIIEYVANLYNTWCDKNDEYYLYHDDYREYSFTIEYDDFFGDTKRVLFMNKQQYKELIKMIDENELFKEAIQTIPDTASTDVLYCNGLTTEQTTHVYNTMRKEIENISYNDWLNLLRKAYYTDAEDLNFLSTICLEMYSNGQYNTLSLPITSITPEAYKLYIKYYNSNNKEFIENILNNPEDAFSNLVTDVSISSVRLYNTGDFPSGSQSTFSLFLPECSQNDKNNLCSLLKDAINIEDNEYFNTLTSDYRYICYIRFDETYAFNPSDSLYSYRGCYIVVSDNTTLYSNFDEYKELFTPDNKDNIYH